MQNLKELAGRYNASIEAENFDDKFSGMLAKEIEVSRYFPTVELRDGAYWDCENNCKFCDGNKHVVSIIEIEKCRPVYAEFFLCEGYTAETSCPENVFEVIELWEEINN